MGESARGGDLIPPRTVLVVEDNAFLADLVVSSLSSRGFVAHGAHSVTEAWRAFDAGDPDALVMDINLGPGINGLDLAQAMMERSPGLAVVFLTELAHPRLARPDGEDLPPRTAFLTKSRLESIDELLGAIEGVLSVQDVSVPRHDLNNSGPWGELSNAQIEVLSLVAQGMSNQDIATSRGTQVRAVEALISRTFEQLHLADGSFEGNRRVQAARAYLLASRESVAR